MMPVTRQQYIDIITICGIIHLTARNSTTYNLNSVAERMAESPAWVPTLERVALGTCHLPQI